MYLTTKLLFTAHHTPLARVVTDGLRAAMSAVKVEETSVLHLIRDYLEEAGLCESLQALEAETGIQPVAGFVAARRLALNGKWRELENALQQPEEGEREGEEGKRDDTYLQRAKFVLVRQQYVETLARLDATAAYHGPSEAELEEICSYLEKLKRLAPSEEEYLAVEALSDPDSSLHEHSCRWDLHSSRVESYSALKDCLSKWYLGAPREGRHSKQNQAMPRGLTSKLVLLVAKGKMYEECEEVCRQRCSKGEEVSGCSGEGGTILDVSGWLQSQPEGMFHAAPSPVQIVTSPHHRHPSSPRNGRKPAATGAALLAKPDPSLSKAKPHMPSGEVTSHAESGASTSLPYSVPPQHLTVLSGQHTLVQDQVDGAGGKEQVMGYKPSLGTAVGESVDGPTEVSTEDHSPKEKRGQIRVTSLVGHPRGTSSERAEVEEQVRGHKERVKKTTERLLENAKNMSKTTEHSHNSALEAQDVQSLGDVGAETKARKTKPVHGNNSTPAVPPSGMTAVPPSPSSTTTKSAPKPTPLPHQFEDDFAPPAWLLETTPLVHSLQREGRNSSTPKPTTCPPPSSPPSSPVPHIPETVHGLPFTPARHEHPPNKTGAGMKGPIHPPSSLMQTEGHTETAAAIRKQIDFQQEARESGRDSQSIGWPTATLAGKVSDTQVVRSVAFSQSGEVVAVGANSKTLRLYSTSPLLDGSSRGKEMPMLYHHPRYHRGSIYCLAWWSNSLLASGSNDKTIQLLSYRLPSETYPCTPRGQLGFHSGTVRELLFLPSGQLVSGGAGNPSLAVSDCKALKMVGSLTGHTKQVLSLGLVRDSAVVSGGEDQTVRLWDSTQFQCVHTLAVGDTINSLSIHDQQLAVALSDGSCSVYDIRNWKSLGSFQPHSSECRSVRYSPDGKWLLTGSYDESVGLTEAASMEWVELAQHQDKVIQARWHPEGNLFASSSADKTACFWTLN